MGRRESKKRIVFLIGSMRRGGAERVISILANSYADIGWEVDILTLLDHSNHYDLNKNINFKPICREGKSRIRQLPYWIKSIRKYVRENKPDRVVSFIARINVITIFSCIGLRQQILVSERNDPASDGRSAFVRFATHLLYPLAHSVVFQTKWAQSCFSNKIQRKSVIIPNPINISVEASNVKEKKIVAVGRLLDQKNHRMLIDAFKEIYELHPEYKLYIYGEGKLREALSEQIKKLKLSEAVFLPGNVSKIHERIKDAEIFVLSSKYEGLSNALLEAMMMGLPCISTECAGANEVIKNGKNGLLIPIGDKEKLIEAMEKLILEEDFTRSLGEEAKRTSSSFNSTNVLKQWKTIIES